MTTAFLLTLPFPMSIKEKVNKNRTLSRYAL